VANAAPDPAAAASTTSSTSTTSTSSSSTTAPKPDATPSTETFTGSGTFFYQNGVAGACGSVHKDSDAVVALDTRLYGDTGVASPFCGKQVKITNVKNQKSVFATVADACPTCNSRESVDMSVGAFTQIADEATGEVTINWNFVS
jgi:expansin (peptidoglycan-binding protein)